MTPSLESRARRHYLGANVAGSSEGFVIELDGRMARTPGGRRMVLPTETLARLVAQEWNEQKEFIDFETMPVTRLARVAIEALPAARAEFARRVADYAGGDLLCYFAEGPTALIERQEAAWQPILDWAQEEFGLVFQRARGIAHRDQLPKTLLAVDAMATACSDFQLAGLVAAAQLFGSAILALAVLNGRLSAKEAFVASRIDETFQAETWGEDAAAAKRVRAMACEAEMLGRWFAALR